MHLSRLLLLSLALPACVLPATAQSASKPGAAAAAPQLQWLTPPADSRTRIPAFTMKTPRSTPGGQVQFSLDLKRPTQPQIMTSRLLQRANPNFNPEARRPTLIASLPPAQTRGTCYSMRNYRFERERPDSDSTSFKYYSTCQSAAQFQAKTVVGSGTIRLR